MTNTARTTPATKGLVLHWAARYDLLVWLLTRGRDRAFREKLVDLARLTPGEAVLDVGCGTGSLAIVASRKAGLTGMVCGIDPSPAMIARARSKATKSGIDVQFETGVAEALPFPAATFDVVLSTLMLHHLPREVRQQFVREVRRVLKPTGRVLIVDFANAQEKTGLLAHVHRHGHVDPRQIVSLLEEGGFHALESGRVAISSLQFVLATVKV
jgi:ubiquinone/menaquinone biosynthesis C-methylase UbiE